MCIYKDGREKEHYSRDKDRKIICYIKLNSRASLRCDRDAVNKLHIAPARCAFD